MIWNSRPWKADLGRRALWLRKKRTQRRWPEAACTKVEQCIMVGCYAVRKLIDAGKLTDSTAKLSIPLVMYKPKGTPVHLMNWHEIDRLYDLGRATRCTRRLRFVCNQVIHSYVFVLGFGQRGGLDHVLFCSDRERNMALYYLTVADFAKALNLIAQDDSRHLRLKWKSSRRDYEQAP